MKDRHKKEIEKIAEDTGHSEDRILDYIISLGLREFKQKRNTSKFSKTDILVGIASLIGIIAGVIYILKTRN